jgi:hypothetical protein
LVVLQIPAKGQIKEKGPHDNIWSSTISEGHFETYIDVILESELKLWGRSPVRELNDKSL